MDRSGALKRRIFGSFGAVLALASATGVVRAAEPSAMPLPAGDVTAAASLPVASRWSVDCARQLVAVIEAADSEGLDPQDYQLAALRRAVAQGPGMELDAVADAAALSLAHDYYFGRVTDRGSMGWMIERSAYEQAQLPGLLQAAVASGSLATFYKGLLPGDARYAAFRAALADAPDQATRDRLRVNMERARWLPRTLAADYLYVNVPSYKLAVIDGGQEVSTYTVVVGAKDTPTPMLVSPTSSLVVNPWWNVPQSIIRKSNMRPGRAGFQFTAASGGYAVRQPPGPRNALGRIKFNLINDQAIYLHDTPAKSAFAKDDRALSHGCVRVKDIDRLADELMSDGGEDTALDAALARKQTATVRLPQTWQVYIVYFTADVDSSGTLVTYDDPYGYDARLIGALGGRPAQIASR